MPSSYGSNELKPTELQICEVVEVDGRRNAVLVAAEFVTTTTDEYGNTNSNSETQLAMCVVLCNGVTNLKYVHNFAVGEKVLCAFPKIGDNNPYAEYFNRLNEKPVLAEDDPKALGFVIGTFYDENNLPPVKYPEVTQITFDGGFIRYNAEDKEITIKCASDFTIFADNIRLN